MQGDSTFTIKDRSTILSQVVLHGTFIFLLIFVAFSVTKTFHIQGDGLEYILQTQAIVFDHSLAIDTEKRAEYWNKTNPYQMKLGKAATPAFKVMEIGERAQSNGGFGSLYADKNLHYRDIHSWIYSAAVAPVYYLLSFLNADEYRAFQVVNLICLFAPLIVAWLAAPSFYLLCVVILFFSTPLVSYSSWSHPEVFQFSCVALAFLLPCLTRGRKLPPCLLGVAAAQNFPMLLFFPLYLVFISEKKTWKEICSVPSCLTYACGLGIAFSVYFYNIFYFGTANLLVSIGYANFAYASWQRALDIIFSPTVGAFWGFPVAILGLLALRQTHSRLIFLATIFILAFSMSAMANLNSANVGTLRYVCWIVAPLLGLALSKPIFPLFAKIVLLIIILFSTILRNDRFIANDIDANQKLSARARLIYTITGWQDDPEIFAESVRNYEFSAAWDFNGIYIWNVNDHLSVWYISKRAVLALKQLSLPAETGVIQNIKPQQDNILLIDNSLLKFTSTGKESFLQSPVLGSYLVLTLSQRVDSIKTNVPVFIAN